MRFCNDPPGYELTYADVFILPSRSAVASRHTVDLTVDDGSGITVPLVAANMTSVSGRRMAETLARRGALAVLPQDLSCDAACDAIAWVKGRDVRYDTPVTVRPDDTPESAAARMSLRAHGAAAVMDGDRPLGVVTAEAMRSAGAARTIAGMIDTDPLTLPAGTDPARAYEAISAGDCPLALILDADGSLAGVLTARGALRSLLYQPATDRYGRLRVAAALGINGDLQLDAKRLLGAGADVLVLDTAHGHQDRMIEAVRSVRAVRDTTPGVPLVAGNVVTAAGVADLVEAGADIVKVGVGPGAMCTTRIVTGVGRPQFSAVRECAAAARELGARVWADGGCRYPRDVALALAAGASSVMVGSLLAGTYESPGPVLRDGSGGLYKEHFGMASRRAVEARTSAEPSLERARKALFVEGASDGRRYLDPGRRGAEDVLDMVVSGVRSAFAYAGAHSTAEFRERVVVAVQSPAGYDEGRSVGAGYTDSAI